MDAFWRAFRNPDFTRANRYLFRLLLKPSIPLRFYLVHANSSALALPQVCELDDSKKFFENVSERGQGGNRDYHVVVSDSKNLEYIMSVLKQLL